MQKTTCLTVDNRKKIHDYISKYPGIHLGEIIRISKLNTGTVRYHLKYLEKNGIISKDTQHGYCRYYLTKTISKDNKKIFNLIRSRTTRDIILYLLATVVASQKDISEELGKTPKTIEYHLKKLMKNDIIQKAIIENGEIKIFFNCAEHINKDVSKNSILYTIKEPYKILEILEKYKKKLIDGGVARLILNYIDDNDYKDKRKSIDYYTILIDRVIDWYKDIFPPFYIT